MAEFTRHAREQMAERGVTPDQVEAVLAAPRTTGSDALGNRVFYGVAGDVALAVVVRPGVYPHVVITTHRV